MFNNFNGMFGRIENGMCRLTMTGNIAVKTSNGYKSYNVKTGRLTNCTNFCFNVGDEYIKNTIFPITNLYFSHLPNIIGIICNSY